MRCTQAHLYLCQQTSPSTGKSQIRQQMTFVILRIMLHVEKYPQNKRNSEGCKTFMVCGCTDVLSLELHYHGKSLLSQLVALAHFKASTTVPRHWNCGCVAKPPEHPPFPVLSARQGLNRSDAFLLPQAKPHMHHDTKQSYHFHEFHSSKSTKGM